jgi:soluble lytic murein transglycosylase-like protein
MTVAAIPLILFSMMVIFNNPEPSAEPMPLSVTQQISIIDSIQTQKPSETNVMSDEAKKEAEKEDFNTIYRYISTKFKHVNEEDANLIASHLVLSGKEHDIDPKLAAALIGRESSFNKQAVSVTGAKGLGQIKDFNFKSLDIADPYDIKENVNGTVKYLKMMIKQWKEKSPNDFRNADANAVAHSDVELALASYFKGYSAVKKQGMDNKTKAYVADIIKKYREISETPNI